MRVLKAVCLLAGCTFIGGCVEQEPYRPTEKDWKTIRENILKKAPTPKYAVNASFEGKVVYLGLDVDKDPIVAGEPAKLTHYWKVLKPVPEWRLFVHLDTPKDAKFINADHKPVAGLYPVSMWKPGEIIRDEHQITLPRDWPESHLKVLTGLWHGAKRLKPDKADDGKSRMKAALIPVKVSGSAKANAAPKTAIAPRTTKAIKLDGKLDDPVWSVAKSTGVFVETMTGAAGKVKTEAKFAWDDKYLYVAWHNVDKDVWGDMKKRDDQLWTQEAVELFIDADGDGKDYVELQVSPHGTIFDSYLPQYRRNQNDWNSGMKVAVAVDGTLNKRDDVDRGWSVEIAVPWKDAIGRSKATKVKLPPAPGDAWRVNSFRLDRPKDGKRQFAVGWSAPLVGDFHKLERFGELKFADKDGNLPKATVPKATVPKATGGSAPKAAVRPVVTPKRKRAATRRPKPPKAATAVGKTAVGK